MMNQDKSRFSEWDDIVDCNSCKHYWKEQCDGVSEGDTRHCKTFLATRGTDIPLQIKRLKNTLKWLVIWCTILSGVILGVIKILIDFL